MGGILYLILCVAVGCAACETLLPNLRRSTETTFDNKPFSFSPWFILAPAWFLSGTVLVTWCVYLTAYGFYKAGIREGLLAADLFVMAAASCLAAAFFYVKKKKKVSVFRVKNITAGEGCFLLGLLILISLLMFRSFFIKGKTMYVGLSVFGDFAPHLGMIRSFSYSDNFPTSYAHYAGEDIRYHFMLQFLTGNLERLGLRVDYAFNIVSIAALLSTCMLLYVLAVKLTGKRLCGYLSTAFFLFRSSLSFFRYLSELPKGQILSSLSSQTTFISYTEHEDWGLWNLNVYCNQRHFAFVIALLLLAVLYFLPYAYRMAEKLASISAPDWKKYIQTCFFTKTAFGIKHVRESIFLGLLLGLAAFFNASVVIACLLVLFFLAIFSDYRLDYLITAVIASALAMAESKFFVDGAAVSPRFFFGFLAENKTLFGTIWYMWELWGALFLFVLGWLILGKGMERWLVIAFSSPLFLALTLSLTPDVTVNHKFVMISAMLLSVYPAMSVTKLFLEKRFAKRLLAVFLSGILVSTGVFDCLVVYRQNDPQRALKFQTDDPLTAWIRENASAKDIILSPPYHLHRVVLGGGMLYYGWPYYAWSAGYDTGYREKKVAQIYEADSREELETLTKEENIRYIIVDEECRNSTEYTVEETVISSACKEVYSEGEGTSRLVIYDTAQTK